MVIRLRVMPIVSSTRGVEEERSKQYSTIQQSQHANVPAAFVVTRVVTIVVSAADVVGTPVVVPEQIGQWPMHDLCHFKHQNTTHSLEFCLFITLSVQQLVITCIVAE